MPQFIDEPITVIVRRMRQIDDLDSRLQGGADFLSRVTIDGKVFNGQKFDNQDDLNPGTAWTFTNTAAQRSVVIKIEVDESDDGPDDEVDVNPLVGKRDLNLRYDPGTQIVTNLDNGQVIFPDALGVYKLQGAGDSDKGAIEFTITGIAESEPENSLITQNQFSGQTVANLDFFGGIGDGNRSKLASGDFNNDGRDDLAIGARDGFIHTVLGSPTGLNTLGTAQSFNQQSFGASTKIQGSVATGDINGDNFDDLVTGVSASDVAVVFGSGAGLNLSNKQSIFRSSQIASSGSTNFGGTLLVADFNNDGFGDVVTGAFLAELSGAKSGAVQVDYGSALGVTTRQDVFHRATPEISGLPEDIDRFGFALAAGDLNGDGFKDLVVGANGARDLIDNAGAVHVVRKMGFLLQAINSWLNPFFLDKSMMTVIFLAVL